MPTKQLCCDRAGMGRLCMRSVSGCRRDIVVNRNATAQSRSFVGCASAHHFENGVLKHTLRDCIGRGQRSATSACVQSENGRIWMKARRVRSTRAQIHFESAAFCVWKRMRSVSYARVRPENAHSSARKHQQRHASREILSKNPRFWLKKRESCRFPQILLQCLRRPHDLICVP